MKKIRFFIFFIFFILLLTLFYPTPVYGAECSNTQDGYFKVCVTTPVPSTLCLPSPGDRIRVFVEITSRIANPFPVGIVIDYGVDLTAGGNYVADPDYRSKRVTLPAYRAAGWTDSENFSFNIVAGSCEVGLCQNVNFSVAPFITYFNVKKVTTGTNFPFAAGIGGLLWGRIYNPGGVTPAGGATVTLSSSQSECGNTSRSVTTGDNGLYSFWNLNCCYDHTLTASKIIGGVTCSATRDPDPTCNASAVERNLTLSCASPSPSPSASPSPSPSSSASPSPSPPANTVSLTSSCGPPSLSASWNRGPGSTCNAYIQAGTCAHHLDTDCTGSWSGSSLPNNGTCPNPPCTCPPGLWNTWSGTLKVSNGTDEISDSETISCAASPPPGQGCYQFTCRMDIPGTTNGRCYLTDYQLRDPAPCDANFSDPNRNGQTNNTNCVSWDTGNNNEPNYWCGDESRTKLECVKTTGNCNPPPICSCNNSPLSVAPNPARVGQPMTFQYNSNQNTFVRNTWSPANSVSSCTEHLLNNNISCTASNTTNNGVWTHYWKPAASCSECSRTANYSINTPITPWIQVSGDVHTNSRINAPGGP